MLITGIIVRTCLDIKENCTATNYLLIYVNQASELIQVRKELGEAAKHVLGRLRSGSAELSIE